MSIEGKVCALKDLANPSGTPMLPIKYVQKIDAVNRPVIYICLFEKAIEDW